MTFIFIILIFLIVGYQFIPQEIEYLQYSFDYIHYLGGHPLVNTSNSKLGTLYVSDNIISFWHHDKNESVFEIPIQQIKNCTIETKESLTFGKIIFLKIFACALKKNKQYIRIEFKNECNGFNNNVIFYSSLTPPAPIIKLINENRINLAQDVRFERGEF